MDKYVGKRLDGRYEIQEKIGVGGMAVVYKAYDNFENRIVAIKILKDEFMGNDDFIRRFKNESKAIAMLSHPNIVKVFDVSFGDRIQYIVMEYIDGITLKEYIEGRGSLLWSDAVNFAMQILRGLQHAHDKGIVHRDVKPQNIMLLSDNSTIKVADFGIARFARSNQKTITDMAIGSVHYISPEQARGDKTDEKADIYSVGVILYEMLTGKMPFDADSAVSVAIMQLQRDPQLPTEINPSIPKGLEQITLQAMQKSPERRYQSAAEMLCDLEEIKKDPGATFDHSVFVDSSPTRFVDEMSSTPASADVDVFELDDTETTENKNTVMIPILSGIAAALVVTLLVLGIVFVFRACGGRGEEIEVPDFSKITEEEIKGSDKYKDLNIEWEYEPSDEYPAGTVIKQSPEAGKPTKNKTIKITVSTGSESITVPDVYGQDESYASSQMKLAGLKTEFKYISDEEVDNGKVIRTEPAKDTQVGKGTEVIVYVSTGNNSQIVDLPNVLKISEKKAKEYLIKAGLVPVFHTRDITPEDDYCPKGYVLQQVPDVNTTSQVAEGSTVEVFVSSGNIKFNLDFNDLPTDFISNTASVSLWINDGSTQFGKESAVIDLSKYNGKFTFRELVTTEKKLKATVKLKYNDEYYNICDITILPLENDYTFDYKYSYPKPGDSLPPKDSN